MTNPSIVYYHFMILILLRLVSLHLHLTVIPLFISFTIYTIIIISFKVSIIIISTITLTQLCLFTTHIIVAIFFAIIDNFSLAKIILQISSHHCFTISYIIGTSLLTS